MTDQELFERLLKWSEILNKEADMICAADRIEQLVRQRDGWEETALMYAQNVDFWKSKLDKAVETLREFAKQKAVVELDDHEYNEADFENAYGKFVFKARAALAELEE